jgi:hypothetical protein
VTFIVTSAGVVVPGSKSGCDCSRTPIESAVFGVASDTLVEPPVSVTMTPA